MDAPPTVLHAVSAGPLESLEGRPLLLLLHGLGADEQDLLPLGPELALPDAVVALRAPLPWGPGWAWTAVTDDPARRTGSLAPAAGAVLSTVDALVGRLGTPSAVRLLGFSQGGALALTLLRLAPRRFAAAVVLAGFLPDEHLPDEQLAEVRPPVFWGRGDADAVIAPEAIARTAAWLPGHARLEERVYPGLGHGISAEELGDARGFLQRGTPDDRPLSSGAAT